jgi:CelD/BcsL family acetyltransferase involved in cellulose biosynthesis
VVSVARTVEPPEGWEALWNADPRATLFLHPRWMRVLARAYPGYRAAYLVAADGGALRGMIPLVTARRLVFDQFLSLPFGAHGGPLLASGSDTEAAAALGRAFRDLAGLGTLRFEMSVFRPGALRDAIAPALGDTFQEFRTHVLDLTPGEAGLWKRAYKRSTRRCVRHAERAGVTVTVESTPEALEILHHLHRKQGRAWSGVIPYSLPVMQTVAGEFTDAARLYLARREGRVVAACLCLEHGTREIHPWASGALPDARESRAFHLLIHTAIMDAARRGIATWHFGGSGGIRGVESFKESFGAAPVPVLRCFHLAGWFRRLRRRPEWDR